MVCIYIFNISLLANIKTISLNILLTILNRHYLWQPLKLSVENIEATE